MKKIVSFVTVLSLIVTSIISVAATDSQPLGWDEIYASYVPELVEMSSQEIAALEDSDAKALFETVFDTDSKNFSITIIRTALTNLSEFYKFYENSGFRTPRASSTTANLSSFTGGQGVSWVRDINSSPLTLEETVYNTYTLEVDYVTASQAAALMAGSSSASAFADMVEMYALGVASEVITAYVTGALGIVDGWNVMISGEMIGTFADNTWSTMEGFDRNAMSDAYEDLEDDDLLRVQYQYNYSGIVKWYSVCDVTATEVSHGVFRYYNIPNMFPGTYGTWSTGICAMYTLC